MNLKSLLAMAVLLCPMTSFALGPVNPIDRVIVKTEQFKGVSYLLEQGLGRSLTANEKAQLARAIPNGPIESDEDKLIIKVADGQKDKSYALWCVGVTAGAVLQFSRAVCASLQTMRTYELGTLGVGYVLEANANLFRLVVSFESSRYGADYDPIPGHYALGTMGATLVGGGTGFTGDSGNKSVSGAGYNIGLGVDLSSVSVLYIQ
jgi:hypothetical protein